MLKILTCLFILSSTAAIAAEGVSAMVYSDESGFIVDAPTGWAIDNNVAAHQGVTVSFYPKGGSWKTSPAVMYARSIDKVEGSAQKAINADVANFSETLPDLKTKEEQSLFTQDNKLAFVKKLESSSGSVEIIAYIPEGSTVSVLALDSKTKKAATAAMPAFKKLVNSYRVVKPKQVDGLVSEPKNIIRDVDTSNTANNAEKVMLNAEGKPIVTAPPKSKASSAEYRR